MSQPTHIEKSVIPIYRYHTWSFYQTMIYSDDTWYSTNGQAGLWWINKFQRVMTNTIISNSNIVATPYITMLTNLHNDRIIEAYLSHLAEHSLLGDNHA